MNLENTKSITAEEFNSLQETLEIMNDAELMKDIKEAKEDFKKGNYVTLKECAIF